MRRSELPLMSSRAVAASAATWMAPDGRVVASPLPRRGSGSSAGGVIGQGGVPAVPQSGGGELGTLLSTGSPLRRTDPKVSSVLVGVTPKATCAGLVEFLFMTVFLSLLDVTRRILGWRSFSERRCTIRSRVIECRCPRVFSRRDGFETAQPVQRQQSKVQRRCAGGVGDPSALQTRQRNGQGRRSGGQSQST
jgi:hypothetical protein